MPVLMVPYAFHRALMRIYVHLIDLNAPFPACRVRMHHNVHSGDLNAR